MINQYIQETNSANNLIFLTYDKSDKQQASFLKEIAQDEGISKYISDIVHDVTMPTHVGHYNVSSYLVKDNELDE